MKCPSCGREIAERSRYCEYCGKPVIKNKTNLKLVWILLALLAALLIGVGCYWYGNKRAERQQSDIPGTEVRDTVDGVASAEIDPQNVVREPLQQTPKVEKQSDFPNRDRVKSALNLHIHCIENDDYNGLQSFFAPRLLRYYSKKNVSRSEIIANHRNYNSTYGVYGKSASYRWETLSVKKKSSSRAEVVCVMDYHLDRVEEDKPTEFVLEMHFVFDDNYHVVSVYDKTLSKY